jgi:NADPH-dependent glutamate synthase beta subunit-like oxidoreductase/NAD-dependent dihydropyrimidine dehydrogenase PreA subunit
MAVRRPQRQAVATWEAGMGYHITIDAGNCINCGICMDVCPVQALDMSRPEGPGVEDAWGVGPLPWMMEHPVQVGECVGCSICIRECPVVVMTLSTVADATPLVNRQGPIFRPSTSPSPDAAWIPLSDATRESLKPTKVSPFDGLETWQTRERPEPWQVWRSMRPGDVGEPIAPCQTGCPAGTDAGRYVGLIAEGRFDDAYAVAAEVNPFASVCGMICTAPCEAVCRRGVLDEPISIRTLKRFAAEQGHLPPIEPPKVRRRERVAIVGGGPAGMSAAYYLARLGYGVTVLEAMPVPGGMMAIGIPDYRLPRAMLRADIDRIIGLGVELRLDAAMGRDFQLSDLEKEGYDAVFLSTGAPRSRRLGVRGDALEGVVPATLFLKRVNLGEPAALRGDVVVVGGGSTAMDAARSALRSGAANVTILYRRGRSEMPAQAEELEAAEHEGIRILTGISVTEVIERDGRVAGVRTIRQEAPPGVGDAAPGANGSAGASSAGTARGAAWVPVEGSESTLTTSTVLVAIGEEPDPSILPPGAGIEISAWAGIVADPRTAATGRAGVFAGGDVVSGPKTIIDAVASGRRAAVSIHEFLAGVTDGEAEIMRVVRYATPPEPRLRLDLAERARVRAPLPMLDRTTLATHGPGFTEAEARAEAGRCFRCDAIYACPTVEVLAGRGPADGPNRRPDQVAAGQTQIAQS